MTTTFRIREPLEQPRTVRLATKHQALRTSPGNEEHMLEIARLLVAEDEAFEVRASGTYPLIVGTEVLSCEAGE